MDDSIRCRSAAAARVYETVHANPGFMEFWRVTLITGREIVVDNLSHDSIKNFLLGNTNANRYFKVRLYGATAQERKAAGILGELWLNMSMIVSSERLG